MQLVQLLLLTAVGVSAHPSGHAHMHRSFHAKRNTITAVIDGKEVSWEDGTSPFVKTAHETPAPAAAEAAPAAPAAPAAAAAAVAGTPAADAGASRGASQSLSTYKPFKCPAAPSRKRATAADLAYQGSTGCNHDGSNFMLIDEDLSPKYPYSILVKGPSVASQCAVWNNYGPDGLMDGFFKGHEAMIFNLPANGVQRIAVDADTVGGLVCYGGSIPLELGQFMGYWAEFNIINHKNQNWSGWDCTGIPTGAKGLFASTKYGCKVSRDDGSQVSMIKAYGAGSEAAFLPGQEALDGIGGKLPPTNSLRLIADFTV